MEKLIRGPKTLCETYRSRGYDLRIWRDSARVDRANAFSVRMYEATGEERVIVRHGKSASFALTPLR